MKNRMLRILVFFLCLSFAGAAAETAVLLPDESTAVSPELALQTLNYCAAYGMSNTVSRLRRDGFEIRLTRNYDKPLNDTSHTSAWTLGEKTIEYLGNPRKLLVVVIRGTSGGEWFSNFDVAPSGNMETEYAENFLYAAREIFDSLQPVLEENGNPLVLVTGHSRGGACANLLGTLLNERIGKENVFVYTFASPLTIRSENAEDQWNNILNFVNPLDLVTELPPADWGYSRAGVDIVLAESETAGYTRTALEEEIRQMTQIVPGLDDYYHTRHYLNRAGVASADEDEAVTVFELLQTIGACTLVNSGSFSGNLLEIPGLNLREGWDQGDLVPLFMLIQRFYADNGKIAGMVSKQHSVECYQSLIQRIGRNNG